MRYQFVYDWVEPIEVADENLIGVFAPKSFDASEPQNAVIERGFAEPVGMGRLRDEAAGAKNVLILSDDNSRPTPVHKLLPFVIDELHAAGVDDGKISFLMSLGTHRPMTDAEIDAKLGAGIRARYKVTNHRWDDTANMANLGKTSVGTDVLVNRLVTDADFVIGIGNIVPHPAAGFAGGGKIVDPGCVSDETCGAFHWESVKYPATKVIGVRDNPMIRMIDEVADKAGLSYIVNTVMDAANRIVRLVTGHPSEAHREGCAVAVGVYGVSIPEAADIVLADSHPADLEMWQAIKGLCTADLVMKDGGIVIMATPCPDGASAEHPEMEVYGYRPFEETSKLIDEGKVSMVIGHHMVQGGRLIKRARAVFIVSQCLDDEVIRRLGYTPARTVSDAYRQAVEIIGAKARVAILRNAAELFPVVG